MPCEVTRHISPTVERELWARSAGRCQFPTCNRLLYKSPVTQERVNISEKAHIYSFSPRGPRGRGPFRHRVTGLNDTGNLMLVCHDCHKTIDADEAGDRYSGALLRQWKGEHETRIARVTGIDPARKSHVLFYGSKIGEQNSPLQPSEAVEAMFADRRFPAQELPLALSLKYEHEDRTDAFWPTEAQHLRSSFERHVVPLLNDSPSAHFSLFALADMPLLMLLGSLFTDKIPVEVYQRHREPPAWRWPAHANGVEFRLRAPASVRGKPALILSLSGKIRTDRVMAVLGPKVAIWELSIADCHNDFLRSRVSLARFRTALRRGLVAINAAHGNSTPLHIFPAIPVACAVECGRVRMPKADMPWIIYDENRKRGQFTQALQIGN